MQPEAVKTRFLGRRTVFAVDVVMFLFACVLARVLKWSATDLIWSLWISSLLVGYSTILGWVFRIPGQAMAKASSAPNLPKPILGIFGLAGALFMLGFFSVHFGGFHFVHSIFLFLFFPQPGFGRTPDGILSDYSGFVAFLIRSYWPFVLAAAVSTWASILHRQEELKPESAYKNVIKMHLMIFAFAFLRAVRIDNFALYVLILFVFFFPWPKKAAKSNLPSS